MHASMQNRQYGTDCEQAPGSALSRSKTVLTCPHLGSDQGPLHYKCNALPLSYKGCKSAAGHHADAVVYIFVDQTALSTRQLPNCAQVPEWQTSPIPGLRPPERFEGSQACKPRVLRCQNTPERFRGSARCGIVRESTRMVSQLAAPPHCRFLRPQSATVAIFVALPAYRLQAHCVALSTMAVPLCMRLGKPQILQLAGRCHGAVLRCRLHSAWTSAHNIVYTQHNVSSPG